MQTKKIVATHQIWLDSLAKGSAANNNFYKPTSMTSNPDTTLPTPKKLPKPLSKALGRTEKVKALVDEAAQDLSSVNSDLKEGIGSESPLQSMEKVLVQSEAIEEKVQEAADNLAEVNVDLKDEIRARHILEFKLVAVKELAESARQDAIHDPLTGLPNRVLFNDRLEHGLAQARRHGWSLAVMFIDLDDFKKVNDTHGHAAGDSVLMAVASRLSHCVRDDDTISRHGGDEFLYLLSEVKDRQDLATIAQKIVDSIQSPCSVTVNGLAIQASVSASVGVSVFPQDGTTPEALIHSADKAMYQAKQSKNRYSFAS